MFFVTLNEADPEGTGLDGPDRTRTGPGPGPVVGKMKESLLGVIYYFEVSIFFQPYDGLLTLVLNAVLRYSTCFSCLSCVATRLGNAW